MSVPFSSSRSSETSRAVGAAVVATWLVTAAWDFVCASALQVVAYHSTFSRLWQSVASAAVGTRAYEMGTGGVAVGLTLHLLVALTWSALFVLVAARLRPLQRALASVSGALMIAVIYGPVIWLIMSFVVIHLATGRPPALTFRWWVQVFAHIPFVTLPLVFTARRMLGLAGDGWTTAHVSAAESLA